MPFANSKKYFRGSFQFSIDTIKKNITPLETLNLIIQAFPKSLKLRILWKKILPGSLKLNFTPNTLDGYGLKWGCK